MVFVQIDITPFFMYIADLGQAFYVPAAATQDMGNYKIDLAYLVFL